MRTIWTLAAKDLRLLLRDRVGFFFTFFFPLLYSIVFGLLLSGANKGESAMPVVVVNEDRTPASIEYVDSLRKTSALKIDEVPTLEAAANLVRRGERSAYVLIPPGFGEAAERLFWGEPMHLEIGVDPGKGMTSGMIEGLITAKAFERMQKLFGDPETMHSSATQSLEAVRSSDDLNIVQKTLLEGLLTSVQGISTAFPAQNDDTGSTSQPNAGMSGWRPVEITTTKVTRSDSENPRRAISSFAICFPQGMIWGIMACAATFATSLLVERTRGTLPRLAAAPLARWQILAGKATACFTTTVGLMVVLMALGWGVFGVVPASVPLLVLAILSAAIGIVGFMMVLSVLGKTEQAVAGISWAVIIVMAMLGGGMLPLMFMPSWMQSVGSVSLVKWAILALEGALWRGFSPAEMALPCGVLITLGLVGFAIGAGVFRGRMNNT